MSSSKKPQTGFRGSKSQVDGARGAIAFTLMATLVLALVTPSRTARAQAGEEEIKAAFLFNFARYVEWPDGSFEDRGAPVRVCVLGADGFASILAESVSGKRVVERSVEVTVAKDPASTGSCHILFIGDDSHVSRRDLLGRIAKAPVLTVSDSDGFARDGGIANFYRADKKVRFEINPGAARLAGLRVSSQLLRLARVVE